MPQNQRQINIKPLSVNQAWAGRRFKTPKYKAFEKEMLLILPNIKIDLNARLRLDIVFGYSSRASDIDNGLKPLLDCLQKKLGINDNKIYELNVKKEIVKKGKDFIKFEIIEL
jgi:Holliday junction resolvase RusA-like endonuclease